MSFASSIMIGTHGDTSESDKLQIRAAEHPAVHLLAIVCPATTTSVPDSSAARTQRSLLTVTVPFQSADRRSAVRSLIAPLRNLHMFQHHAQLGRIGMGRASGNRNSGTWPQIYQHISRRDRPRRPSRRAQSPHPHSAPLESRTCPIHRAILPPSNAAPPCEGFPNRIAAGSSNEPTACALKRAPDDLVCPSAQFDSRNMPFRRLISSALAARPNKSIFQNVRVTATAKPFSRQATRGPLPASLCPNNRNRRQGGGRKVLAAISVPPASSITGRPRPPLLFRARSPPAFSIPASVKTAGRISDLVACPRCSRACGNLHASAPAQNHQPAGPVGHRPYTVAAQTAVISLNP